MTIDPYEIDTGTAAESTTPRPKPMTWRGGVAVGVWVSLAGCVIALFYCGVQIFGMALGLALHANITAASQLPLFWGLVTICIVLALTGVAAIVARRWVALVLVLVIGGVSGTMTAMIFTNVRSIVAPVVDSDPQPMQCQCYSGSFCDCPGG